MSQKTDNIIEINSFDELSIGDIVQLKHAHKREYGYYSNYVSRDYEYLGYINSIHKFMDVEYNDTMCGLSEINNPPNILVGKYTGYKQRNSIINKILIDEEV